MRKIMKEELKEREPLGYNMGKMVNIDDAFA